MSLRSWTSLGLLLAVAGTVQAAQSLTRCWSSTKSQVLCLIDPDDGTRTLLSPQNSSQVYNFSNLNISSVQAWPSNATSIDLSYNIIRELSTPMPSSLYFLNISHNTLQKNWIQTPLTVSVLDVSYNEGGMAWMPNVLWGVYLPKLIRLVFRGNELGSLDLNYNNFPMTPLAYLDLSDNPNLILSMDSAVWNRRDSLVLTMKPTLYEKTVHVCDAKHGVVYSMLIYAVQYLPQGNATYETPYNSAGIVTNVCFLGYTPPPNTYTISYRDPSKAVFMQTILTVGLSSIGVLVAYFIGRRYIKRRNERTPFRRGTFCSSNASGDDDPSTEEAPPTAYSQPPRTPRQRQ